MAIKKFINWLLIKLRIRKPYFDVKKYQDSSLEYLINLHLFCIDSKTKFKDQDNLKH